MVFLKAVLLGLAVAAPLGPIGALCIRRTLAHGFRAGLAGGFGTAVADAAYAAAAAAGLAAFSGALAAVSGPAMGLGDLALLALAWRGWPRAAAAIRPAEAPDSRSAAATAATTFALAIANPAMLLSFAAIFAGLGLTEGQGGVVVLGVFTGSMLWWVLLAGVVSLLHRSLPLGFALWAARGSSLMMAAFGCWALLSAVRG
ncbi:LysE family transporter [Paenirhodobacter sp.]|uniref:LysE family transporter n=1 Tax=Paenirhodobacter sp. TaxID=1965326 RepID=UPI003B50612D